MYPPLFEICRENTAVTDLLGSHPLRIFPFSEAAQEEAKKPPYAVWQTISGSPENTLTCSPDFDGWIIQVDVYSPNANETIDSAKAIRDAVEPVAHIVSWRGTSRDADTNNYRYSFDIQFLTQR